MAEDKKTNPNLAGSVEDAKRSIEYSKEARKVQGDYRNILKESEDLLKKMTQSYDKIEGRLESLNKESINIKQINQEILKAREKDYIVSKKLAESAKEVNAESNVSLLNYSDTLKQIANAREDEKDLLESQLQDQFNQLNLEQQRYVNLVEADKLNKHAVEYSEAKLKVEKEVNSNIGITGRLMGIIGKKLGANNDIYADMVENAKELNAVGAKLTFGDKIRFLGASIKSAVKETVSDPAALFTSMGAAIPIIGGAISGLVGGLKSAFDYLAGIQEQTVKFAKTMNMSTKEARLLKMQFADINVSNGNIFVTTQKLVESQSEMVDLLGTTNRLSDELLSTNVMLKDLAGLDAETRKGIAESSIITGKSAESTVKAVLKQNAALELSTGLQFQNQKILKEAASLGGYLGLQFAKYPESLAKSLVKVKSLGLELKQLDSMADSFLDFESSISKEFEAQLITGKEINLAKAREAFLNNDLATAAEEITRQVGSAAEFTNMHRIKQEALASAMGMSRDSMAQMLKDQQMLSSLGARDLKDAQAKVEALKAQGKSREDIVKQMTEEGYQNFMNASLQEKIANFINKIKESVANFIENTGILGKIEAFVDKLSNPDTIKGIIGTIRDAISDFIRFTGELLADVARFISHLPFTDKLKWQDRGDIIEETTSRVADRIGAMGGNLSYTAANEKAGGAPTGSPKMQAPSTAMGGPTRQDINVTVQVEKQAIGKTMVSATSQNPNVDGSTGKIATPVKGN